MQTAPLKLGYSRTTHAVRGPYLLTTYRPMRRALCNFAPRSRRGGRILLDGLDEFLARPDVGRIAMICINWRFGKDFLEPL